MAIFFRNIWYHRNDFIFNANFFNPNTLLQRAQEKLYNFIKTNEVSLTTTPTPNKFSYWSPPDGDYIKTNWDYVVDSKGKRVGFGIVDRDNKGLDFACLSTS